MVSEKIALLGKGLYKSIPDELTLKSIPTATELDYIGSEDFDNTMLTKILPKAVEEKINFYDLLAVDYYWICRCLRILNYGPYHTTMAIYCSDCKTTSRGEYQVDLRTVKCTPLPEGFTNQIKVSPEEFLEFDKEVVLHLLTISEQMNSEKDPLFKDSDKINYPFARLCYQISEIGGKKVTPIDAKSIIDNKMSSADYIILKEIAKERLNYGLTAGGNTICPSCGSNEAVYMTLVDDRFFRPTVGDLRRWKTDLRSEREK